MSFINKNTIYYTFIYFILNFNTTAAQNWIWQNPLPQGARMSVIINLSANRTIIAGQGGTIMLTNDGGENWSLQKLLNVNSIRDYSFINENEGWIVCGWYDITAYNNPSKESSVDKIFKTLDGGETWQSVNTPDSINFSIYRINKIEFINDYIGFLLLNPTKVFPDSEQSLHPAFIYKTEDGGLNWEKIDIGIERKYFQLEFIDANIGFLISQPYYSNFDFENNLMHRTTDGGKTWETMADTGYGEINFVSESVGWAGQYLTSDKGLSWTYKEFNFPSSNTDIVKITFSDSLIGYALNNRNILKTENGGYTWILQKETLNGLLQEIQFHDTQIGYTCGYGGTLYKTNNGGGEWVRCGAGSVENLQDVEFLNEQKGWAAGYNGTILNTKNGGDIWEKQNVPSECDSTNFRALDFITEQKGWLAGDYYILYTQNGGADWQIQLNIDLNNGRFMDIYFLNENIGFAVGQSGGWLGEGVIYKTIDGGINWQRIDEGNLPILDEIYFVDSSYGWICGRGILLSTKDGGESWESENFRENLRYIQFTDRYHGWISAIDEGAVYRTSDGGINWENIPYDNRFVEFFSSFYFFNNNNGIATGFLYPNVLTTTNGGLNWSYQERLSAFRINKMFCVNDSTSWAIGRNGSILKLKGNYFTLTTVEDKNKLKNRTKAINYPNPFNSSTKIIFNLNKPQIVQVSIYNILGKKTDYFELPFAKSGENEIRWKPNTLTSGIYFINIVCKEFTQTIKTIYIK